ncbi:hypothetical protein [Aureimonas sp. AU40]|uniref:hypothetical protein n=1 Tax=Aureimonas sp. AU40 TaxID=1637747 RepID=UPI0007857598|nr:hypothetical protein [Aureimonas sp. AU40]
MLTSADFEFPTHTTSVERVDAPSARFSLMDDMFVERGTKADWELLHHLHYKAEKLPMGARFWRLDLHGESIGVLVTGCPKGLLKERHIAFPAIKPTGGDTKLTNTNRYKWINANMRVVSRFVVDTMFRGIGAGYRMMNLVSRLEGAPIMEIQSSMSKFNIFGQKAGFRFVTPQNANKFEAGLRFFRSNFEASPQDFEAIVAEIDAMPESQRQATIVRCKDFYLRNSALENTGKTRERGASRVDAMTARDTIKAIQQMSLASPMYGVWRNPDAGREMPARLPLRAFDWQAPTAPMVFQGGFVEPGASVPRIV